MKKQKQSVYEKITNRIIDIIDSTGTLAWNKTWTNTGVMPCNYQSKRPYRGINLLMTALSDFTSPYYLTANQIKKMGGTWKGTGTPIVFWNFIDKKNDDDEVVGRFPMIKMYYVWNAEQIEGIDFTKEENTLNEFGEIEELEDIISNMKDKPKIVHKEQDKACYVPMADKVIMPLKGQFHSLEEYYSTFAHELIHSTGHKKRLSREGVTYGAKFGSHKYSQEELVAELGASFIMGLAGREHKTIENSAAYIKGWRSRLKEDEKLIVKAAQQAQKAVDYIIGREEVAK